MVTWLAQLAYFVIVAVSILSISSRVFADDDDDLDIVIVKVNTPANITFDNPQPKKVPELSQDEAHKLGIDVKPTPTPDPSVPVEHIRRIRAPQQDADATEPPVAPDFWDKTRRKGAKPLPGPKVSQDELKKLGVDPGKKPKLLFTAPDAGVVEKASVTEVPFDAYGKLFFTDYKGNAFECSGAYVDKYVVLTAAHCVYDVDSGQFHKNYQFFQQFNNGKGVKKGVKKTLLFKGWYNKGEPGFAYDYAFLAMRDPTSAGYLELDTAEHYDDWTCAGYPSNYKKGRELQKLHGYRGSTSSSVVETADDPMGPGCSGGPWFVEKKKGQFAAIGVNSFAIDGRNGMFSPRFKGDAELKLFEQAKKMGGGGTGDRKRLRMKSGDEEVTDEFESGNRNGSSRSSTIHTCYLAFLILLQICVS